MQPLGPSTTFLQKMAVDAHTPHLTSFVVLNTCFALKSGCGQGLIIAVIFFSASLHEKKTELKYLHWERGSTKKIERSPSSFQHLAFWAEN